MIYPVAPAPSLRPHQVFEVLAWQYYLDHRQVVLNNMIKFLVRATNWRPRRGFAARIAWLVRRLAKGSAWLALWNLNRLSQRVGSAYTQGDVYLFRSRYGIADDLSLADHFWTLIGHPVGRALIFRDRGLRYLEAGNYTWAAREFLRCYRISVSGGSHLTALKALIGWFHLGKPLRRLSWECHIDGLQGDEHVSFFQRATKYLSTTTALAQERRRPPAAMVH